MNPLLVSLANFIHVIWDLTERKRDTGLGGSENVVSKKHCKIIMMIITVG